MAFGSSRSSALSLIRAALLPALPPLLRLHLDEQRSVPNVIERTTRDLAALAPDLAPLIENWERAAREVPDLTRMRMIEVRTRLVAAVDRRAAGQDQAVLRSLAEVVLATSTAPSEKAVCARVAAAVWRDLDDLWRLDDRVSELGAGRELWRYDVSSSSDLDPEHNEGDEARFADPGSRTALLAEVAMDLRAEARAVALGLSALAVDTADVGFARSICEAALSFGRDLCRPLDARAASRERALAEAKERRRTEEAVARESRLAKDAAATASAEDAQADLIPLPPGHVIVCPAVPKVGADRSASATRGYERIIDTPIPLVATPDLASIRNTLMFEFPHATDVIDRLLVDLVGRPTIRLAPLLLVGRPGGGKTRVVRRLSELLGVGLWRVDGARDTGAAIAGLDRRWFSAEPSHPLQAVNRFRHANPFVLIDEIDKAPTRTDYGRLWDGLLALLEGENAARFMDPCLQVEVDLSHITYIGTANSTHMLPAPLQDRMRILDFPVPKADHLGALLQTLVADYARERGCDPRWIAPLNGSEIDLLRRAWRGGSVRRLQRLIATILQSREAGEPRH